VIFEVSGKLAKSVKYGVYSLTENQFSAIFPKTIDFKPYVAS
jgi:hypothetical protein